MPETVYVCVNGHDRCYGGASSGPECPYCERKAMPDDVKYLHYLGDGVYASVTSGMVKLHTDDGIETRNTIWFEVETLDAFLEWLADVRKQMMAARHG